MMKLEYDKSADVAYIYLKHPIKDGQVKKTVQVSDDLVLDYDGRGILLGIEILNARNVLSKDVREKAAV